MQVTKEHPYFKLDLRKNISVLSVSIQTLIGRFYSWNQPYILLNFNLKCLKKLQSGTLQSATSLSVTLKIWQHWVCSCDYIFTAAYFLKSVQWAVFEKITVLALPNLPHILFKPKYFTAALNWDVWKLRKEKLGRIKNHLVKIWGAYIPWIKFKLEIYVWKNHKSNFFF